MAPQHGSHVLAAEIGRGDASSALQQNRGAGPVVAVAVAEVQRAPLTASERRAAVVVANLEIRAARDQQPHHPDEAAERGTRDRCKALAVDVLAKRGSGGKQQPYCRRVLSLDGGDEVADLRNGPSRHEG